MGEARRRGTYKQRKAAAIAREKKRAEKAQERAQGQVEAQGEAVWGEGLLARPSLETIQRVLRGPGPGPIIIHGQRKP